MTRWRGSGRNSHLVNDHRSLRIRFVQPPQGLTSNIKGGTSTQMRILMITPEGPPLQRTGALIDVMNALPRELRLRGHEVSVVIPHYREIRERTTFAQEETGITVDVR